MRIAEDYPRSGNDDMINLKSGTAAVSFLGAAG
jgi:hypothetical protein